MSATRGTVVEFDQARGDGWIVADSGERYYFHCVAIADGRRSIPVGVTVQGQRRVGLLGADELVDVYSVGL
jgi:cold shock CspA family protein